ncbi:MAG: hypothetical protein AB7Y74_00805 [Syntrophorhabdus sp.]
MVCQNCANWKCGELRYSELIDKWKDSIGGEITPGHLKRYEKEAKKQGVDLEDVTIGYKYCSKGILARFYLRKSEKDNKTMKRMANCSLFSEGNEGLQITPAIMRICTVDSHGPSKVKGINFTPGLYEGQYMRVPLYGAASPTVERDGACSACGKVASRTIVLRLEKTFCCNKHYLKWWAKRYREEYKRLKESLHV